MDRKPVRLLWSMGFSSKHTGVGSHFHLQGIFPTQGLSPSHWEALPSVQLQVNCLGMASTLGVKPARASSLLARHTGLALPS